MKKGFIRNFDPVKTLTDFQMEAIHRGTLDVLEETGVKFESKRALKLLEKNNCIVDYETKIAKIPSYLVEECIRKTPSSFLLKARVSKNNLRIGGNTLYFMNSVGARFSDVKTGVVRIPSMEENNNAVLISDALETVDLFLSYCPYFEIEGIEPVMLCPTSLASRIRYSSKVSRGAQATDTFIWETQLAQSVGQQLLGVMEAASPLSYSKDAVNAAFEYAKADFPIFIAGGAVMGGTAPVTLAGATISNNTELLAAVVLIQLIRPGIGIVANDFVTPMDMQSGSLLFGSLGVSLHQMAFNQIWSSYYRIPINNAGSAFTSSKFIDYQSGYERSQTAVSSALSGVNVMGGFHGGITAELSYNPILAIIDDDLAGMIGRMIEGFDINSETMAVEIIKEVGTVPGTFLNKNHTRENWKREYFIPKVSGRLSYDEWIQNGKKSIIDHSRERMEEILANHKPDPITPEEDKEIDKILNEARKYYKNKGLL